MDKDFTAAVVFYIAVVLCTSVLVACYVTAVRDVSWIETVETFIRKENWEPGREYIPLMDTAFFLNEKGEEEFFYLYSQQEFVSYIRDLFRSIDKQVSMSTSRELLDEIFVTDKVLELVYRFPVQLGLFRPSYGAAYFVLKDELGMGLEGTIILFEADGNLSIWQLTDWFLW